MLVSLPENLLNRFFVNSEINVRFMGFKKSRDGGWEADCERRDPKIRMENGARENRRLEVGVFLAKAWNKNLHNETLSTEMTLLLFYQ